MPSTRSRSLLEARQHRAVEHAAARQLHAQRIDEAAVDQDLVVHVRAGREAGRADIADHLALAHARAGLRRARERGHVAVGGLVAVGMADADVLAVARLPADLLDGAVAGGVDRGAERRGPVDAGVHLVVAEQRMVADAEAGPHDAGGHRLAHQELLRALSGLVVVVDDAVVGGLEAIVLALLAAGRAAQRTSRRSWRRCWPGSSSAAYSTSKESPGCALCWKSTS